MDDGVNTIEEELLDFQVAISTRIPVRLKARLDRYRKYMELPQSKRPEETEDWPKSIVDIFEEALNQFLSTHPLKAKPGPSKAPVRTKKTATKKTTNKTDKE